jgi:hypothetical protein
MATAGCWIQIAESARSILRLISRANLTLARDEPKRSIVFRFQILTPPRPGLSPRIAIVRHKVGKQGDNVYAGRDGADAL